MLVIIVHHHAVIIATVRRLPEEIHCDGLRNFLSELVNEMGVQALFEPIAINGKYGFTGIVGIVTSHIAFHFFDSDQSLHFDVYSCKEFDLKALIKFIDRFWQIEKADILFIKRDQAPEIERYAFSQSILTREVQE